MSNNAHELSNRLLNALDNNYNVVDMHAVNEIISILEKINITKELLETTRLGKHVNELRRKTSEPSLARRAKVLVKRWRDLVIPTVASPGHTGSNRSSAERSVRRHGGTPLTSPALSRVVSPAVPSPRPPSRPAWGGYESDSQDVILVDDEPAPPPAPAPAPAPAPHHAALKPLTPPVKRPQSPAPHDEKKTKRDKKPKKRRDYSRAGAVAEAAPAPEPPPPPSPAGALPPAPAPAPAPAAEPGAWSARNGSSHTERRRNGYKRDASSVDKYAALVHRMPPAGAKKVKTTKELLEEIQSRKGGKSAAASGPASPASPASPHSPDVMLIETESCPIKVESPLRNGGSESRPPSRAEAEAEEFLPLEDEREHWDCTCGLELDEHCPARGAQDRLSVQPHHVRALHNAYLPGVNGTRAPVFPHQFAVRKPEDPDRPGLFTSVVPLYKYSDYADDYCVKNMDRVPICTHLPWTKFAPPPPDLPPPPSPPPIRPYPIDETIPEVEVKVEPEERPPVSDHEYSKTVEAEMVGLPALEPSERLKAPLLSAEEETQFEGREAVTEMEVEEEFASEPQEHRTVERTKEEEVRGDGRALYAAWQRARDAVRYDYEQLAPAPVLPLPEPAALEAALDSAESSASASRDELGRPPRPRQFAEWHECARLGPLVALPYVVID